MNSNQKFSRLFLLSFLTLFSFYFTAQSSIITGIVVDENKETMPGVNVKVFGKDGGTTTDFNGKYVIGVDSDSVKLIFSFIGYRNFTTELNGRNKIDVQLQLSTKSLDEVVVVGYGKTTVKELTGATVQVKGESIERLNIPRMDQALQGQVSGVTINTNSG